ncbi:ENR1 protein, partial [Irena cyanogastra]|nr:ENR1 protein [Irena cyanogastra]NXI20624.1 ENR1 protein [Irena cyanogastra]
KNLFLDLVEKISHEFNVINCWICGDTRTAEIRPWEEIALSPQETLKLINTLDGDRGPDVRSEEEIWNLRSEVIGQECIWRKGLKFLLYVGELSCKRYLTTNDSHDWWIPQSKHLYWAQKQKPGCSY